MEFRHIDGSGNSLAEPGLNEAGETFSRLAPARYADGVSSMPGGPNPRTISNIVVGEGEAATPNGQGLSGMMYAWGQFIDHDLTRTLSDRSTDISVEVPDGDLVFADGTRILLTRAAIDPTTGTGPDNPIAPTNAVTAWLDASVVYGSSAAIAASLRGPDGRLLTSAGDNLPIARGMFLAGDERAAENPSLTSLQTLFVREHNWHVARLAAADPSLSADDLYEQARAIVGAEIAHITYAEFLPKLVGAGAIPAYAGYDPTVDPRLSLEFAGAAYRWGHSTVSAETERKDELGAHVGPELALRDAFFMAPDAFAAHGGAAGFLRHLATDRSQAMDARIVEDLRSFLLDADVGQDLAAINIQRGRDLGLPTLNGARAALGLEPYADFADITDDAATVAALRIAYAGDVDSVDLWTGGLSEKPTPGAFLGETFGLIVAGQFEALRDGDRFWFENAGFDFAELAAIKATRLSHIILRNTDTQYIQDDVFLFAERRDASAKPEEADAPQLVVGSADEQVLVGGSADDLLAGRDGDQTLIGGAGSDRLDGGGGVDILFGQDGDDRMVGGAAAVGLYNQLWGGDGRDEASYAGASGAVYASLEGFGAFAMDGALYVLTDAYNSVEDLAGGAQADVLVGDAGANRLLGGGGADQLYGRGGADVFVYRAAFESSLASGYDTVADFVSGEDRIDLSAFGLDPVQVRIASDGLSTGLYADLDPAAPGEELAIAFVGADALLLGDIIF